MRITNILYSELCDDDFDDSNDCEDDKISYAGETRTRTHSSEEDVRRCLYF